MSVATKRMDTIFTNTKYKILLDRIRFFTVTFYDNANVIPYFINMPKFYYSFSERD